jgi:hypothetical protein
VRGPRSFGTPLALNLFEKSRTSVIFAAMVLHKSTFLASPEWKTLPWQKAPESKAPIQYLVDILAGCPNLLEKKDRLTGRTDIDFIKERNGIVQDARNLLSELEDWKAQFDANNPDCVFEVLTKQKTPQIPGSEDLGWEPLPLWDSALHYSSFITANSVILYNAIHIFLYREIRLLSAIDPGAIMPNSVFVAGLDICRSVEYHLLQYHDGIGSFNLLFPLKMAWDAVGRSETDLGRWLENVLQDISTGENSSKWAVAGYLLKVKEGS